LTLEGALAAQAGAGHPRRDPAAASGQEYKPVRGLKYAVPVEPYRLHQGRSQMGLDELGGLVETVFSAQAGFDEQSDVSKARRLALEADYRVRGSRVGVLESQAVVEREFSAAI